MPSGRRTVTYIDVEVEDGVIADRCLGADATARGNIASGSDH